MQQGGDPGANMPLTQCVDGTWCCGGGDTTCCNQNHRVVLAATVGVTSSPSVSEESTSSYSATASPTSQAAESAPTNQGIVRVQKIGMVVGLALNGIVVLAGCAAWLW
jgi:hypothetical protein